MSGGPEVALGRSADQMGLEIEGIVERGVRVWERPLWVESSRWRQIKKLMIPKGLEPATLKPPPCSG
jgi:hypothetical protein